MYPLICYDFETCNDYSFKDFKGKSQGYRAEIIKMKSFPLELSLMYVKELNAKPIFTKLKVKFSKRIENCSDNEKETLAFYFAHQLGRDVKPNSSAFDVITLSEVIHLLKEHNKEALSIFMTFKKFLLFIKKFIGTSDLDKEKFNDFTLLGKNNQGFDDYILNNFLSLFFPYYLFDVLKGSWDVQKFIFDCKDSKELSFEIKKHFRFIGKPVYNDYGVHIRDEGAYTLSNIYENLFFKKMQGAHDSKFDVWATYKIFEYYFVRFPKLVENSCQVSYLDLSDQFKTLSVKEVKN